MHNAHPYADAAPRGPSGERGPWHAQHFRLFLSHAHSHSAFAGEIRRILLRWSVDTFVAHDTIEPSREWEDEIESALGTADALAALLTPEFVRSDWCDQEVGFSLARGVPLVPITFGARPHGFIGKFQALRGKGRSPWDMSLALFRTLATHDMAQSKMDWPIVQRYVKSPSFEDTREAFKFLKGIPADRWTGSMIKAVEEDALENRQVSDVFPLEDSRPMPQAVSEYLDDLLGRVPPKPDDIPT